MVAVLSRLALDVPLALLGLCRLLLLALDPPFLMPQRLVHVEVHARAAASAAGRAASAASGWAASAPATAGVWVVIAWGWWWGVVLMLALDPLGRRFLLLQLFFLVRGEPRRPIAHYSAVAAAQPGSGRGVLGQDRQRRTRRDLLGHRHARSHTEALGRDVLGHRHGLSAVLLQHHRRSRGTTRYGRVLRPVGAERLETGRLSRSHSGRGRLRLRAGRLAEPARVGRADPLAELAELGPVSVVHRAQKRAHPHVRRAAPFPLAPVVLIVVPGHCLFRCFYQRKQQDFVFLCVKTSHHDGVGRVGGHRLHFGLGQLHVRIVHHHRGRVPAHARPVGRVVRLDVKMPDVELGPGRVARAWGAPRPFWGATSDRARSCAARRGGSARS